MHYACAISQGSDIEDALVNAGADLQVEDLVSLSQQEIKITTYILVKCLKFFICSSPKKSHTRNRSKTCNYWVCFPDLFYNFKHIISNRMVENLKSTR